MQIGFIFQSVAAPVFSTYCTGNIVQSYLNSTQNTTTPRCGKHHFDSHPRGFCLHENFKHGRQLRDQRGLLSTYSLRQIPNIMGMNGISEWNLIHFDFERRNHWRYFGTGKHFPIFKLDMHLMMHTLKFDLDMCFLYITWCRLLVPCLSHLTLYRDSGGPQVCNF